MKWRRAALQWAAEASVESFSEWLVESRHAPSGEPKYNLKPGLIERGPRFQSVGLSLEEAGFQKTAPGGSMKRSALSMPGGFHSASLIGRATGLILVISLQIGAVLMAQSSQRGSREEAKGADASVSTGPEIGQKIPNFRLQDQNGRMQDLKSVMGPKGVLISFNRSADW